MDPATQDELGSGEGLSALPRARTEEIERAVLARVSAIAHPAGDADPEYAAGLDAAIARGVRYAVEGLGPGGRPDLVPEELLSRARHAARAGVPLGIVLRRYSAAYALLGNLLIEIAEAGDLGPVSTDLGRIWRTQAVLFDCLVNAVVSAYDDEVASRRHSARRRRAEQVRLLLAGQLVDVSELSYELDAWHIGLVASGAGAADAVSDLATALDRSLLVVRPGGERLWGWLGGTRRIAAREVLRLASLSFPAGVSLAIGEPSHGIEGWRLSHRQARDGLQVAKLGGRSIVRYTDVALVASALRDEVLAGSLHHLYLAPLVDERDRGAILLETLRAYFFAGRNVSSAAAALGISRPTATSRLRSVEERLGQPLEACAAELETALRLHDLDRPPAA